MGNKIAKFDGDVNPNRCVASRERKTDWYEYEIGRRAQTTRYTHSTYWTERTCLPGHRIVFKYKKIIQDTSNPNEISYAKVRFVYPKNINTKVVYPKVVINLKTKEVLIYDDNDNVAMRIHFKKNPIYNNKLYVTNMYINDQLIYGNKSYVTDM